jgi:hypothetical protein
VKWVAKSVRPFSIVEDEGFNVLMKTGRPNHYLPSRHTVARDVKHVFRSTRKKIAKMLQVGIVLDMGNPWVFLALSLPVSVNTRTHGPWVRVLTDLALGTGMGNYPYVVRISKKNNCTVL